MSFIVTLRSDVRDLWYHSTTAPLDKRAWPWTLDKARAHKFSTKKEAVEAAVVLKKDIPYPNKIEVVEE
jgi:hypothetical protein